MCPQFVLPTLRSDIPVGQGRGDVSADVACMEWGAHLPATAHFHGELLGWWQNGRMADWQNGGMAEWQNGRMAEWQNGRLAEWRNLKWCRLAKVIRPMDDVVMRSFINFKLTFSQTIFLSGRDVGYLSLLDVDVELCDLCSFVGVARGR